MHRIHLTLVAAMCGTRLHFYAACEDQVAHLQNETGPFLNISATYHFAKSHLRKRRTTRLKAAKAEERFPPSPTVPNRYPQVR